MALARIPLLRPRLLILDEPTPELDMSMQATVLELRRTLGLTYLFISRDLSVVERLADRVAIMVRGRIVECVPAAEVFARPSHSYTQSQLAAAPRLDRRLEARRVVEGDRARPSEPTLIGPSSRRCGSPGSAITVGEPARLYKAPIASPARSSSDAARSVDAPHPATCRSHIEEHKAEQYR